jgi:hypothetical protein
MEYGFLFLWSLPDQLLSCNTTVRSSEDLDLAPLELAAKGLRCARSA